MRINIIAGICLIVSVLTGMCKATAQLKTLGNPAGGLNLSWQVVTNNYQNKSQSRSVLVFTAGKGQPLPATGWRLYFNFARKILPESITGNLQLTHINGDLFYFAPLPAFKGLPAGQSHPVEFTSADWVVNATDAPGGFYWVWDNQPEKTYAVKPPVAKAPVSPEQYMRAPLDKVGLSTAETIFQQNKAISNIPAGQLTKVFPTPLSYQETAGTFALNAAVTIRSDAAFATEKAYLQQMLSTLLLPAKSASARSTIILQKKPMANEAYG